MSLFLSVSPYPLCPLGVALSGALGSLGQGPLPESQSVCTLGRNNLTPVCPPTSNQNSLVVTFPQLFPRRCVSSLHEHEDTCQKAQEEESWPMTELALTDRLLKRWVKGM